MCIPLKLLLIAERAGYFAEYRPTRRVRGWPTPSARPYQLSYKDGTFLTAFATLEALERAVRARAGC